MARIKKGDPLPGEMRPCSFCGKMVYRPPSKLHQKKNYCKEHKYADAFNFPCLVCSKPIFVTPSQLILRSRSTCTPACRSTLARKRANEKRAGYTKHQLDRLARYSPEAKKWREAIFARDDYTCQFCNKRGGNLEADHIKPWAYFSELRFVLGNGRTLCRPCHDTTKISAKEMKARYTQVLASLR